MGDQPSPQAAAIQSAPVPTPAPPVTAGDASVVQAENDQATENLIKKSVKRTMLAGDTGGFNSGAMNVAGKPAAPASYKAKLG